MNYFNAAESAPQGAEKFSFSDLWRLPGPVLDRALEGVPEPEWALAEAGDETARRRVVRALFWTLVYHLEPRRWDALSRVEPIHPGVLAALPAAGCRVLEVAAGTGRLTSHLARVATEVVAVEPAAPLRDILAARLPAVRVLDGEAARLPLPDGWADLSVVCASLGPDLASLTEIERCTRGAGTVAFISPENPAWLEARGYLRRRFDRNQVAIAPHDPEIDAFFGPLDPPHELLLRTL